MFHIHCPVCVCIASIYRRLGTHYWKCKSAKKKRTFDPPIWNCCGPTTGSCFTHRQIKHPPFSEIAVKTHSQFGPYLADYFACVPLALKRGWLFHLPMGKKWIPSGSSITPYSWYWKFFIFGKLAFAKMCVVHITYLQSFFRL